MALAAAVLISAEVARAQIGPWRTIVTQAWQTSIVALSPVVIAPWRTSVLRLPLPDTGSDDGAGVAHRLEGIASYYWQGQATANGETFDPTALTAAHPTLPFNSLVRVTNVVNGRSVLVRINDRGPFKAGRVIDLSEAAAEAIDMRRAGLVPVRIEIGRLADRTARSARQQ
jgi:rare lipoprotein A